MAEGKIRASARWLRRVTIAALLVVVLVSGFGALGAIGGGDVAFLSFETGLEPLGDAGRIAGAGVTLAGGALFAYGLWRLSKMLALAEAGEAFSTAAVGHLRAFALFAFVSTVASILLPPLLQLAIIVSGPVKSGRLTLSMDGNDLWAVLISGLLFLVAHLLAEAQRIADDNKMIV